MERHKNKIIAGIVILTILSLAFFFGGNLPNTKNKNDNYDNISRIISEENDKHKNESQAENTEPPKEAEASEKPVESPQASIEAKKSTGESKTAENGNEPTHSAENTVSEENIEKNKEYSEENGMKIDEETGKDRYMTEPVPEGKPVPVEEASVSDKELTCTLSVRCDTILDNIEHLAEEKVGIVPQDGVIFAEKTVTFYEGESVFNLLLREMKRNKIHMEFENTPIYNSAYIEGIANLYEFDCGELSGWMYRVNGWFPNYGCSRYQLREGDCVEWIYTCDLGADIDGEYSAKGE